MGHFYAAKAEEKLAKARQARKEVSEASNKIYQYIIPYLQETNVYVDKIYNSLKELNNEFTTQYFDVIKAVHNNLDNRELFVETDKLMQLIGNGMALCAVMADIITTPLFKLKDLGDGKIEIEKDEQDRQILNKNEIDLVIAKVKLS